jgi:hypothetical protein
VQGATGSIIRTPLDDRPAHGPRDAHNLEVV